MSIKVPISLLSQEELDSVSKDLQLKIEGAKFSKFKSVEYFDAYEVSECSEFVFLPLAYTLSVFSKRFRVPDPTVFKKLALTFNGTLRDEQVKVKDEAIKNLNKHKACLISCFPGFGKTLTSIYISISINLKTLIIVNKLTLIDQWVQAINTLTNNTAKVKVLSVGKYLEDADDFVIVNCINIPKFPHMTQFGTLIVDECHLITSKVLSQSIFRITPRYVIGLSATPYRPDGLNKLIDLFFTDKKIIRDLMCPHVVYKVVTNFKPIVEYSADGKVNWNKILESQCGDERRNGIIIDIISKHKDRNFMILSKRVEQSEYLYKKLQDRGEKVAILVGSSKVFDKECRILIGTSSKLGTGFDFVKLNALILASDMEEYFIQYLGRIFRVSQTSKEFVKPIVFDLLDENPILKRHFATRRKVYHDAGGVIETYQL